MWPPSPENHLGGEALCSQNPERLRCRRKDIPFAFPWDVNFRCQLPPKGQGDTRQLCINSRAGETRAHLPAWSDGDPCRRDAGNSQCVSGPLTDPGELLLVFCPPGSRCSCAQELLSTQTVSLDQAERLIWSRAVALAPAEFQLSVADMRFPLRTSAWWNFLVASVQSERRAWLSTTIFLKWPTHSLGAMPE